MRLKRILFFFVLITVPLFGAETDLEKAIKFRKGEEYAKAERLLKKYSSPAGFDALKSSEKIDFLRGLLELAHIRALKDDVSGSLSLLNWAEGRKDPYQRAIACVKYAEILLDLGEFERASAYLKNADEIIRNRATEEDTGAAIGQGGISADTGAIWRDLRGESDALKADIESEEMKKRFGASYGNYVKLRRLQVLLKRSRTPRYMKEAMRLADELMETDPASQFAAAAGYLKGEIMASCLNEESPKKEIKEVKDYLNKFVKQQPDGLYRGEALMLLGKISLEIEWNAKNAEKYYSQALDWFRKAREKRDAVSLYAAMNDDLKQQSMPTQKPTTLNQWKRIVYHDEDPLKLYNTAHAPVWYVDDKVNKNLMNLGFLKFANSNFVAAEKLWEQCCRQDEIIVHLESLGAPNLLKRLKISCKQGFMITDHSEQKGLSSREKLQILYGEFYYLKEQFNEGARYWKELQQKKISLICRAIAVLGEADCLRMLPKTNIDNINRLYIKIVNNSRYDKFPISARANYNVAWTTLQASSKNRILANQLFEKICKEYPKSKYAEAAAFYLVLINLYEDLPQALKYASGYKKSYPRGNYTARMELRLKNAIKRNKELKENKKW